KLDIAISSSIKPNLTGYTLVGEDKINYRSPTYYYDLKSKESEEHHSPQYSITFFHLGSKLSGHEGIVHGGLIATLLDELTCGVAFLNFESKRGVTANLNVNYRQPVVVNSYVLVKCEIIKKEGRKCWVKGSVFKIETGEGEVGGPEIVESRANLLTEAEVLVIEPKWVEKLTKNS
ncbi:Thioesterase/thiol ester dehydrase-isomerase, partial [Suhomyces tanzawaensis NRRL Y-17324]